MSATGSPFFDDECHYCQQETESLQSVHGKRWCGRCREGRIQLTVDLSTDEVAVLRNFRLGCYLGDPVLSIDRQTSMVPSRANRTPEERSHHIMQVQHYDAAAIYNQVLGDRGDERYEPEASIWLVIGFTIPKHYR